MVVEAFKKLNDKLTGAIVKTAEDADPTEAAYYFDVLMEHSISVQNQITDNYIENNTAIQDHIAQSPITVSLRGLIGELVYKPPTKALEFLYDTVNDPLKNRFKSGRVVSDKLLAIPALLPPVDNITQRAKNAVQYVEASVDRYVKIAKNFLSDTDKITQLEKIYSKFMVFRANNTELTVVTPFKTFGNMYIQSITFTQGNENFTADIQLTLKQINYAETQTTKPDTKVMAIYNAIPRTTEANHGKAQGARKSLMAIGLDGNDTPFSKWHPKGK